MLFDEADFFARIGQSGARVLLIGRRALIAYGLPVLTADYDLWVHVDDIERLNEALGSLELEPSCTPSEARRRGRYVLENDEHVDVLVARSQPTVDGVRVHFDQVWERRNELHYDESITIAVPCLEDLVLTKRWAMRDKDVADIRMLEALRQMRAERDEDG